MVKQVLTGVLCALFAVVITIALASGNAVSRPEVERMIEQSENRTVLDIQELKADQKAILAALQQIQIEVTRLNERNGR